MFVASFGWKGKPRTISRGRHPQTITCKSPRSHRYQHPPLRREIMREREARQHHVDLRHFISTYVEMGDRECQVTLSPTTLPYTTLPPRQGHWLFLVMRISNFGPRGKKVMTEGKGKIQRWRCVMYFFFFPLYVWTLQFIAYSWWVTPH